MLKRLTGTEKMSITPHTSSNCINMYIIPSAGTDAKNLAMNLKTLTEASHLISTCDVGTTAPGVGTPCLPAHVSFLQNLIFNTVGRRYSRYSRYSSPSIPAGLHKLWYPGIRDTSMWSKFGAHGEHGDVFLFSNLGAL